MPSHKDHKDNKRVMKDIRKPAAKAPKPADDGVLYLEADEEITTAIDRLRESANDQVRIVVPKRSTLFQSVVNQKLLARAAETAGKEVVLVTSDHTASHLASQVGLAVAATVKAEASIPEASGDQPDEDDTVEAEADNEPEAEEPAAEESAQDESQPDDGPKVNTVTPANSKPDYAQPVRVPAAAAAAAKAAKPKKSKNAKVPNFGSLQKRVIIIGAAVFAVLAFVLFQYYFKRATLTLYAKGELVNVNASFTADPNANSIATDKAVVPAKKYEVTHSLSGSTAATGSKDVGAKATGTMTISNCQSPSAISVPAGSTFTANGLNFTSNSAVSVPGAQGNFVSGCTKAGTASVSVTAAANGDNYNLSGRDYSNALGEKVTSAGSQMSGGVSKVIKIVTQGDVDKVSTELLAKDKDAGQKEVEGKLTSGQTELTGSFTQTATSVTSSPAVGSEGDNAAVTVKATYSMLAVNTEDLTKVIRAVEQKQVGVGKQIYEDGVKAGKIGQSGSGYVLATTASAGQKIDIQAANELVKGKKSGPAIDAASKIPGVSRAELSLWPSWSVKVPSISDHITVNIKIQK